MTDFDNLDDIFNDDAGDEIDLDGTSFAVNDFEEDLFEEQQQTSINRTFVMTGGVLLTVFAVAVAAIVGVGIAPEDTGPQQTADAILTLNAAEETKVAVTAVAVETERSIDAENTLTQEAANVQTQQANATGTQIAIEDAVAATETRIAVNATQTQSVVETSFAQTQTANAPTPQPTVQVGFEIRDSDGNPVQEGVTIFIYRDDGDRQFDPLPSPTPVFTPTPSLTPTLDATQTPTQDPTIVSLTLSAEISEFDRRATARAQEQTSSPPAPVDPTDDIGSGVTPTPTATVEEVSSEATPVAEAPDVAFEVETKVMLNAVYSVRVPVGWNEEYPDANPNDMVFAESFEGLDYRSGDLASVDDPASIGLGGRLTAVTLEQLQVDAIDDVFFGAFVDAAIADLTADGTVQVLEAPTADPAFANALFVRVGVLTDGTEEGFIVFLAYDDVLIFGQVTAPAGQFEANRVLLRSVVASIVAPPELEASGYVPNGSSNTNFMKVDGSFMFTGPAQGGPTPTPLPGGDEEGIPIQIGPNGQGQITLPGEPGTYFLVVDLLPGIYTLFIEGQAVEFEVIEGQVTESVVILAERTLIIRARGLPEDIPTPTLTPSPTATEGVIADTPVSPFLQTATAAARTALPDVTEPPDVSETPGVAVSATVGAEELPTTGLVTTDATTPEGLAMLAVMGIGLLGVVFVVRRLRANIE